MCRLTNVFLKEASQFGLKSGSYPARFQQACFWLISEPAEARLGDVAAFQFVSGPSLARVRLVSESSRTSFKEAFSDGVQHAATKRLADTEGPEHWSLMPIPMEARSV